MDLMFKYGNRSFIGGIRSDNLLRGWHNIRYPDHSRAAGVAVDDSVLPLQPYAEGVVGAVT